MSMGMIVAERVQRVSLVPSSFTEVCVELKAKTERQEFMMARLEFIMLGKPFDVTLLCDSVLCL